ncbi:NAD(P)H-quinone oxidoreductase [Mucilaginibacter calamicampi]|uniref:NAD(P)H-quinone oxidoreductase n=1 Tax=Mucilaginibacter calamicampi TaxID=1302352 RepID=A0ABW2YRM0_9SPHI
MQAIIITQPGGPEVLQIEERPVPAYGENEVLIKVAAAGINRPDIFQRKGNYPPPNGAPADIPGLEIAGTIAAIGSKVSRWQVGDKVCSLVSCGGYAEYCNVPEGQCLPIPENLSFTEAASLPETFFTVWSNVFNDDFLKAGDSMLVHGGSGGIGSTAIQIAKALGITVYTTAGSADKCAFCESLGADRAINYKTENFADVVKQLTNGRGIDLILDSIGGDYTPLNLQSLAEEGRLVIINAVKGKNAAIDLSLVMRKRLLITGSMLRPRDTAFKSAVARQLEEKVWPFLISGKIKPVIFKAFPAAQAAAAHSLMESSEHMGKIVLEF